MSWWTKVNGAIERHASKIKAGWHLLGAPSDATIALYRSDPRKDAAAVDVLPAERVKVEQRRLAGALKEASRKSRRQ